MSHLLEELVDKNVNDRVYLNVPTVESRPLDTDAIEPQTTLYFFGSIANCENHHDTHFGGYLKEEREEGDLWLKETGGILKGV